MTRYLVLDPVLAAAAVAAVLSTGAAEARGCLKGAPVGGLAGHTLAGAGAGCAIGHHYANRNKAQPGQPAPSR